MVLFTPITTVTLEGVKLSDLLFPTSRGSTIWTVPGWVEEELVEVVVAEELDVWLLVEELAVVLLVVDEAVLVVVRVETEEALVVEDTTVVELELEAVVEDWDGVEVEVIDALLVDVVSPTDEVEKALVCEEEDCVLPMDVDCDAGWRNTSAAKAPPTRISVTPAIRATLESRPARPSDFLAGILCLIAGRAGALSGYA
jgi:hypothetical protein